MNYCSSWIWHVYFLFITEVTAMPTFNSCWLVFEHVEFYCVWKVCAVASSHELWGETMSSNKFRLQKVIWKFYLRWNPMNFTRATVTKTSHLLRAPSNSPKKTLQKEKKVLYTVKYWILQDLTVICFIQSIYSFIAVAQLFLKQKSFLLRSFFFQ